MDRILRLVIQLPTEQRDQGHFPHFQGRGDNPSSPLGKIVFEGMADFLDETMVPQAFEHPRDLRRSFVGQKRANGFVGQAADIKFPANHRSKQIQIVAMKQIEAAITATIFTNGTSNLFEVFRGRARVIDGRQ